MSKLYFRYGTMNSGKSTSLLQVANNYEEGNMKPLIIKHRIDDKGNDTIVSKLNIVRKADFIITNEDNLYDLIKQAGHLDCILVDEAQFCTKTHIEQLYEVAVLLDIPVICYGLRTDFKGDGFLASQRLLELAHTIEELKTVCSCGKKAVHNARTVDGKIVFEGEQILIDNKHNVKYIPLCSKCYLEHKLDATNITHR